MQRGFFMYRRLPALIAILVGSLAPVSLGTTVASDFDSALSQYEAAVALPTQISFDAFEAAYTVSPVPQGTVPVETHRAIFRRDGNREYGEQEMYRQGMDNRPEGRVYRAEAATDGVHANVCECDRLGDPTYIRSYPNKDQGFQRVMWRTLMIGRGLEGYISEDGDLSIADALRKSSSRTIASLPTTGLGRFILKGDGVHGHIELTLNSNYRPVRIELAKRPGNLMYGKPFPAKLAEFRCLIDSFQTTIIDGRALMSGMTCVEHTKYSNGHEETLTFVDRRNHFLLGVAQGTIFAISAPNGLRVFVQGDESGLQYVWDAGRVVPEMRPGFARAIDGQVKHLKPFPRPADGIRTWIYAGIGVIVLVSLTLAVVLMRRRRLRLTNHH